MTELPQKKPANLSLSIGALGVVFGDIGTSPLYAFRESFVGEHRLPIDPPHVFGVLSLIVWALILVVTVKYVLITMRADNHGEGGSFALLALIKRVAPGSAWLPMISTAALMATALFYGDAVITPAISILSAVEGVKLADPAFATLVVPVTLVITVGLFAIQHRGTGVMGRYFGPVMVLFFVTIGALGVLNIRAFPSVIQAVNPWYAFVMLGEDPMRAFLTLGTVVLTITGAEALYADMGHFGRVPITRAWMIIVLPGLLLCYAGQAALILTKPAAINQAFFLLAPGWGLWPLLTLATAATVIASQSAITGAFSVTAQAIQLGYLPRLKIVHTSEEEEGQIFAPGVNIMIFVVVVSLILAFRSSDALASAFGFAVTSTMVLTTLMMGFVIFRIWRLHWIWAVPVYAVLLAFDLALFAASSTKIPDGAWLPMSIAAGVMVILATWSKGLTLMTAALGRSAMAMTALPAAAHGVIRVPGQAVYLTRGATVPTALVKGLELYHVLHEQVLLVAIETAMQPHVEPAARLRFNLLAPGIGQVGMTFGFLDEPDVPATLALLPPDWRIPPQDISYFLGRVNVTTADQGGMAAWREALFRAMARLSGSAATAYFRLPAARVVEVGTEVAI